MRCQDFSSYWAATETYDALKIYMDMDFDGLRSDLAQMLGGGRVKVNTRSFQNDMRNFRVKDDVLTLLIHLGYLAYDAAAEKAFIPSKEIIMELKKVWSGAENSMARKSKVSNPKLMQRRRDFENHFDH